VQEVLANWPSGDELIYVTSDSRLAAELPPTVDVVIVKGEGRRTATIANVARETLALVRARRPEVLISASPSFLPPLPGSVRRLVVLHDLFFRLVPARVSTSQRLYRDAVYRSCLRSADVVVSVSHRTAHDLGAWIPGASRKTVVIPNAAADSFHEPPRWSPPGGPMRLVVPAHNELKGTDRVIAALAAMPDVHADLLAGSPERVRRVSEQAGPLGERVAVLGHLAQAELRERMVTANGMVMASDVEGFGLPALEALAMDVPVVVSPDPALREATNGAAVTMANWSDAALVAAIRELPDVPEAHWRQAGQWARSRSWRDVARELRACGAAEPPRF
jgi:glycosyltransferase involved in cell wall biosynthesis